jgi:FtsP/CotA-like multicopper oxidase with cupredoxin domain
MTRGRAGAYQHWRVVNKTHEVHPFHIHQVHFLFYATNDRPEPEREWLDTVNVPTESSVDLIMDFTKSHHSRYVAISLPSTEP